MDMVSLTIDGIKVQVPAGTTVLEAARSANIQIPTLCYLKDVNQIGAPAVCAWWILEPALLPPLV